MRISGWFVTSVLPFSSAPCPREWRPPTLDILTRLLLRRGLDLLLKKLDCSLSNLGGVIVRVSRHAERAYNEQPPRHALADGALGDPYADLLRNCLSSAKGDAADKHALAYADHKVPDGLCSGVTE